MRIAFVTPVPELQRFATASNYHLILTHICDKYPEYTEFYRQRAKEGDYIILDNSAHELGQAVPAKMIRKYAEIIKPSIVVLPDVVGNGKETLRQTKQAVEILKDKRWKLMAVPQAPTTGGITACIEMWIDNLKQMYEIPEISAIGIPLELGRLFRPREKRAGLAEILERRQLIRQDMTYHMLGLADVFEVYQLSRFPWIFGCDSAKPLTLGAHGVLLHADANKKLLATYPRRPENYFDLKFDDFQAQCIRYNQQVVLSWAKTQHGPSLSDFLSKACKA